MDYACLIVDDEAALAQSTCEYFNLFGVRSAWVASAQACREFLRAHRVELLLLDINLPDGSGFSLCKQLRAQSDLPILFISARTSDDDQVLALGIGGDDYIPKPYSLGVLLAKVKAVLKRRRALSAPGGGRLEFGALSVDLATGRAFKNGEPLSLTALEYRLLAYMAQNRGRVLPKEELFARVWEDAITGDGTLNVHIRRLREKIEDDPTHPVRIKTVWGTGYLLEEDAP